MMLLISAVLALLLAVSTHATSPGLSVKVSQHGLNYAGEVAIQLLSAEVKGKPIPDQHGSSHVAVGTVKYDITNMRVTSFPKPTSAISVKGHGIALSVSNIAATVHGNWHYEYKLGFIKIRDSGSFDVSVSRAYLNVGTTLGASGGRPTISMTSCSSGSGSVNVHIHGGASWLYNIFSDKIENPIADKLRQLLCSSAKKGINIDAERAFQKMKVRVPLDHSSIAIDYRLVSSPKFGSGYLVSYHKGEFFWGTSTTEAPFQPKPISSPAVSDKMVLFCLADYVVDTLGYVLNKHGLLKYIMTKKDVPSADQGYLNTTCQSGLCIGKLFPQIEKHLPNGSVEVDMKTTSDPKLITTSGSIGGQFIGVVVFNVRMSDGTVKHAFTTDMVVNVTLKAKMVGERITAEVQHLKFHVNVTKSDIGPIPDVKIDLIFGFAVKSFLIPKLNEIGKKGFLLPKIDAITFVDSQIYLRQNTLCFGTNAKYAPGR